jgi:hypothetical protein
MPYYRLYCINSSGASSTARISMPIQMSKRSNWQTAARECAAEFMAADAEGSLLQVDQVSSHG